MSSSANDTAALNRRGLLAVGGFVMLLTVWGTPALLGFVLIGLGVLLLSASLVIHLVFGIGDFWVPAWILP